MTLRFPRLLAGGSMPELIIRWGWMRIIDGVVLQRATCLDGAFLGRLMAYAERRQVDSVQRLVGLAADARRE